jgi:hypothetical protein
MWSSPNQDLRDQPSPPSLVTGAAAAPVVSVEIFMEGDQIPPVGIIVKQVAGTKNCAFTLIVAQEDATQPLFRFFGDWVQGFHIARTRWALHFECIAVALEKGFAENRITWTPARRRPPLITLAERLF